MKKQNESNSSQFESSLEELMPATEELQFSKEESVISRKELQKLNEKLAACNAELQSKVEELNQANSKMEVALKESEQHFRLKHESILATYVAIGNLELSDVIDARALQSLIDDFHELTRLPISLIDINGKILAGVGWQDICTKFHRVNPDTCSNCIESDVHLSAGVLPGDFKLYKCMNNMWDVATPIMIGDRLLGNLFMGQFFFEDEPLDYELFRSQAKEYGFDEKEYIAALDAAPRLRRETLNISMSFFMKLADILSKLGYSNLKLARSLAERDALTGSLRENEERLRLFIEHAPAALAMFDTDMRYVGVSRRWLRDYGLGERALTGESHYDIFPEITEEWRKAHRRCLAGEVLRAEADRFARADGSVQWVRWEIRPWQDAEGKIGGIVIFTEDISDIKLAEEVQSRYELLARYSRDIILFMRRDNGRILEANAAAVNTYGYVHEELLELTIKELCAPETVALADSQMAEADTHGILFETVHRRRDGSTFPVEVSSQGATIGGTRTLISVIRDITERKKAEKALWESEIRYHDLFENMLEGFAYCRMFFDDHGRPADFVYLDVNNAFGRLTGLEGVTGKKVTELIPGIKEAHPELFEIYGRVALTGQTEKFELKVEPFGIWLSISVYSPEREHFVAVFDNITERKRAESALRDSERLYRAIGESIDYGIWTCTPDGRCTYASESFLKMVGMTQEQCSNFGWGNVLHPDDAESTISAWNECVRSEGVWDIEHRFRGTDGQWHPVLARGVPVRNDRGEVISWAGINLDISRMKRTEDELRASEEKFSTMLQTVPIAIALATSPDGALYNVNPAWLDLTGITRKEDAIGKTSLELGLIGDAAQRESILNEFRQNGFARNVELTFRTRKGVQRTVLVNLDRVEIGGRAFILSTMEEITERKRAEEALQQKQTELLEAQSIAKIGSWFLDARTDVTTGSDELLRIYGFDPATQVMPDFRDQRELCYPVADWERINAAVQETLITGVGNELDVQAYCDGALIWATIRSEAVLDAEGRIVGLRGTVQDVTERKHAEEELLEQHRKLEHLAIELSLAEERERDRIAGELHDQVGQRLILGKMKLGALASQIQTDKCLNDVEELDRIIDLSIQDIRTLTFQLRPPLLASAGLEAALHWLGEEFHEQHGLLLTFSDDGQQKTIRYEARSTVFQAAREMLLNIVKHADATQIGIAIRREADMLQVCLSDNGCGFDVAEARLKKSKSGGFGLINVQRRIEHLGGSIIIESQPGHGTCVTIVVPLDASQ